MRDNFWPTHWPEHDHRRGLDFSDPGLGSLQPDAAQLCVAVCERIRIIKLTIARNETVIRSGGSHRAMTAIRDLSDLFYEVLHTLPANEAAYTYSQLVRRELINAVGLSGVTQANELILSLMRSSPPRGNVPELVMMLKSADKVFDAASVELLKRRRSDNCFG